MSYHIKSGHIISPHDTSYHTMSDHFIPYHVISYHIKSSHHMPYQNISSRLMSYHIKARQIILDHIISHHVISYPYLFRYIYLTLEDLPISSMKKMALFGSPEVELESIKIEPQSFRHVWSAGTVMLQPFDGYGGLWSLNKPIMNYKSIFFL